MKRYKLPQQEVIQEKAALEEELKTLTQDNVSKETELQTLRHVVEEKTTACTEAESKLAEEIKSNEEHRQTITALRADVSNLTIKIAEYQTDANAAKAAIEVLEANYQRETNDWNEYKDSLKKSLDESEKATSSIS